MDANDLHDLPPDPNASWRPTPERELSASMQEFFAQTTPLPERHVSSEATEIPAAMPEKKFPAAYLLNHIVAQGGHGEVWQGVQVSLSRRVAVKKIRRKYYQQQGEESLRLLEMTFHREALVTGRLDHPSIVPIYDIGNDQDGHPLLAMKLVVGTEWTEILNQDSLLDRTAYLAKHLPILISVAQAVAFAHSRAVIHRDLKPSQVMVGKYGEVFLMDWGLAAIFDDQNQPRADAPTLPYSVSAKDAINPAGTTAYMAPEQTESTGERLGPWTDVWLLGGILYRILTETAPYNDDTSRQAFERARKGVVDPPEMRAPYLDTPSELSRIAMKALSGDIGRRYASVQEFITELDDYLRGNSRRAESEQLTAEAQARLRADSDYQTLSQCDNLLSRASSLWPENPQANELHQQLLLQFAEKSIQQGDLGLARLQTGRLVEPASRQGLNARIEQEALRLRRLARQRKIAIASCFMLVLGLAALGHFMIRSRANAKIRQHIQNVQTKKAEQEKLQRQEEAEEARRRAELARRTSDLYAAEQVLARDLVETMGTQLSISPTLVFNPYDEQFQKSLDPKQIAALESRVTELQAIRNSLDPGILGAEPSSLPYAAGIMMLYHDKLDPAEQLLLKASALGAERHQGMVGLATVAFRRENYDLALQHLDSAGRLSLESISHSQDYRKILALAHEAGRHYVATMRPGPEDIVIEPRAGGKNFERYSDTSGFVDTDKPHEWAKSYAPGSSVLPAWGSRCVRFYTGVSAPETTLPASAFYRPGVASKRHLYVYATWPYSANASPVTYRIKHAAGESTRSIVQDGWEGVLSGNANLWTPLGDYDFNPGEDQYLELYVDKEVQPVRRAWNGQAVADAVLFSSRALDKHTTAARNVSEVIHEHGTIPWSIDYNEAVANAKRTGKNVFVYITSGHSAHLTVCENKVFPRQEVVEQIERLIPVTVSPYGNSPENIRFGGIPTGTVVLCDFNGSELKRISPEKVLSPEILSREVGQ